MAWTNATSSLAAQIESYLATIVDGHERAATAAWVRAWDTIGPDLELAVNELVLQAADGRLRRADVIRSARLQAALEQIHQTLDGLIDGTASDIIDQLADIVDHAGSLQERIIASQLPAAARQEVAAWSRTDPRQLAAIVDRTAEQITKLTYPLADEAAATMRRELVRGIAVGDNPRAVAARMVRNTEVTFNGGLHRATVIARTEMLDAHRRAAQLADDANADLLTGWTWTCALVGNVCRACLSMHGREFPLDQSGPEGHPSCRCARVAKTKSWRDLGFDIDEPDSLMPSAVDYFDGLSKTEQVDVLGQRGWTAWNEGRYPMDQWASKRTADGWRDSWVPSPAPA